MPARPFALLHGAPRPGLGHVAGPNRRLLVEAVEEEGDVVLEAGDGGGGGGPGAEAGVGRGGVEAVGVGDAGAGHGPCWISLPPSRSPAGAGWRRAGGRAAARVRCGQPRLLLFAAGWGEWERESAARGAGGGPEIWRETAIDARFVGVAGRGEATLL